MKQRKICPAFLPWLAIVWVYMGLLLACCDAEKATAKARPLAGVLQEIGSQYKVTIVADASIQGVVNEKVDTTLPVEEALSKLLEPIGYSFSLVDGYYVVCSNDSPMAVFVHWQSCKIPVGFIAPELKVKLTEYKSYLHYNNNGVIFLKAPSSKINEILNKIWSVSQEESKLTVVYCLKIIDLIDSENLDRLLEGVSYNGSQPQKEMIITPEKLLTKGYFDTIFSMKENKESKLTERHPWLAVLPGETVKYSSLEHYIGDESNEDQKFSIEITPISVNPTTGEIVTKVDLIADEDRKQTVSTVIKTHFGISEPLAVVKRVNSIKARRLFGWRHIAETRDYGLVLTAIPLNIQQNFINKFNIIPWANFDGIDKLDEENDSPANEEILRIQQADLIIGANGDDTAHVNPWLSLFCSLGNGTSFQFNYERPELYELGYSWDVNSLLGTSLELRAGEGIGPNHFDSILLGISDRIKTTRKVTLFAKYYLVYLLDEKELADTGFWECGAIIKEGTLGMSLAMTGSSEIEGYKFRLNFNVLRNTWIFGADTTDLKDFYQFGLRFKL